MLLHDKCFENMLKLITCDVDHKDEWYCRNFHEVFGENGFLKKQIKLQEKLICRMKYSNQLQRENIAAY